MEQWLVVCLLACVATVGLAAQSYSNYHLLAVRIQAKENLAIVSALQKDTKVDIWSEPRKVGQNVTLSVAPDRVASITSALTEAGMRPHTVTTDLQGWIAAMEESAGSAATEPGEEEAAASGRLGRRPFTLSKFHRHAEINEFLENVARRCQEGVYNDDISCEVLTIGESYEGRPMNVLHIYPRTTEKMPAIWIDAGIHAREWAAPATAIYIIYKLLDSAQAVETQELLLNFQWYILPSANPDGYEYSHTDDRMWRKSRSHHFASPCIGTDPNRNWGFHWNEVGASDDHCSNIYAGYRPFSEMETGAMKHFLLENKESFLVYLTFHAYGQYWLTPWGYTSDLPEDYDDLVDVAYAAVGAVHDVNGLDFTVGTSTNVLYAAAGGSDDWAKGVAGIKYAYTVELRDNGRYGFMMPRSEIVASGKEMWAGVKAMAQKVQQHVDEGRTDF